MREICLLDIAFEARKQIHDVSAAISLCGIRLLSEQSHQAHQVLLKLLLISKVDQEAAKDRLDDHTYLTVANIVIAVRFHERMSKEQRRASTDNLVAHLFHQPLTYILQHHLLQGKDGSFLSALDQTAPPQRLQGC